MLDGHARSKWLEYSRCWTPDIRFKRRKFSICETSYFGFNSLAPFDLRKRKGTEKAGTSIYAHDKIGPNKYVVVCNDMSSFNPLAREFLEIVFMKCVCHAFMENHVTLVCL